jgi:lactoylglutathione lyase
MSMPPIRRLDHVALHVADVAASTAFYRSVLGLALLPRPEFPFPGAWLRLGLDQELHLIGGRELPPAEGSRGTHFALAVDDLAAAAAHLRANGVAFRGPGRRPDGAGQIFLEDPDGHVVELTQLVGFE